MKKYLASILTASLLFGVSIRAEEVEKKETKAEENAPVVKEEAKNQNVVSNEEKGTALAYTLVATGGAVAGWVISNMVKKASDDKFLGAFVKDATAVKVIYGLKKDENEKKQAELKKQIDKLYASQVPTKKDAEKIKKIAEKIAIYQRALQANQENNVEASLKKEIEALKLDSTKKYIESINAAGKKFLKKEDIKVESSANNGKTNVPASTANVSATTTTPEVVTTESASTDVKK